MLQTWLVSLACVFGISLVSLVGLFALSISADRMRKILYVLVAFAAGAMLGDVFFHLLPELVEERGFSFGMSVAVLSGIIFLFIVEKFIHWRHCHLPACSGHVQPFAIMNLVGDAFHNLIDGIVITTSFIISFPVGIATTIAVAFHEIPQEIGDFGILLHGGLTKTRALVFNFLSALVALLGVAMTIILYKYIDGVISLLLPFTMGTFIYIASSDLIPEIHKEVDTKKSIAQLFAFAVGIFIIAGLLLLHHEHA